MPVYERQRKGARYLSCMFIIMSLANRVRPRSQARNYEKTNPKEGQGPIVWQEDC